MLAAVPDTEGPATGEETEATATWFEQFTTSTAAELSKYTSPKAVAKVVVPTGLVCGVGALGALIGPHVGFTKLAGFVAGGFVAKLALGQAKPGEASAKIEKAIEPDETPDPPE